MLQYSVYSRITRNNDDARKYINKVKVILPPVGSVRVLQVTEKQYASMIIMLGDKTPTENLLITEDLNKVKVLVLCWILINLHCIGICCL